MRVERSSVAGGGLALALKTRSFSRPSIRIWQIQLEGRRDNFHLAVVVAVAGIGMMQVTVYQIVDVISMRHCLMPAIGAMLVLVSVRAAFVIGCALVGVFLVDRKPVLVDVVLMRMMQVPVVEVVEVAFMPDGKVPTADAVHVRMALVGSMLLVHLTISPALFV